MTKNQWNIFLFPTREAPSKNQSEHTVVWIESRVHTIEKSSSQFVIYSERNTRNYLHAGDFFRILFTHEYVSISTNNDSDITYDSIMSVWDENEWEYQLPVDYFIRMTAEFPSKIRNDMESIMDHISNLNIRVGMHTGDYTTTKTILTEEELDDYKPEVISWFTSIDSNYECELYHEFGLPIWYGEIKMFNTKNHPITLLDLMILSMEDTELGGYKIAWANMEVISIDGDDTTITTISSEILEKIIYNSLKRINPLLYGNMTFRSAHQYYFQKIVIPKMKPENETIDIDE
jgi:hypothetical protein